MGSSSNCTFSAAPLGREDLPVNCVDKDTAQAACEASGGSLPRESQWEMAAVSIGYKPRFAWGDEVADCRRAIYARTTDTRAATDCVRFGLGVRPGDDPDADVAPTGVVNLGGSVSEAVLDDFRLLRSRCWLAQPMFTPRCEDPTGLQSNRGGNWANGEIILPLVSRFGFRRGGDRGFRCARKATP